MLMQPMDVLTQFPVRKSGKQKKAFRSALQDYAGRLGYACREEKTSLGGRNLVLGNPETAQYLVTAHYDTCAVLPVPNLITPCNLLLYILWQIVLTAVIFLAALVPGILVGVILRDGSAGFWLGSLIFWVVLLMVYVGPANRTNANDNTSGVVTVLEMARALPREQRDKVCFVLFDLEEAGLIGSAGYRKRHKEEIRHQLVLNLDCVGDGDELMLFPSRRTRKDREKRARLEAVCGPYGEKNLSLRKKGFAFYPSDQMGFPYGVGICALRTGKLGWYLSRIHTWRDTILEVTNVNILRDALIQVICGGAVINGKEEENHESI